MKKYLLLLAVAICGTAMFTSCDNEDEITTGANVSNEAPKLITFNNPFVGKQTRAEVTGSNITSQTLKVWADKQKTSSSAWEAVFPGTNLTYSGGKWTPATNQMWYYGQNYRFMAISPASANATYNDGTVTITNVPCANPVSTGTDYLVSNQVKTTAEASASSGVSFSMQHILGKLNISFKKTGSYNVYVTDAKIWMPVASAVSTYVQSEASGPSEDDAWSWGNSTYLSTTTPTTTTHRQVTLLSSKLLSTTASVSADPWFIAPVSAFRVYLDLNYEIRDTNGNTIRSFTKSKTPVIMDINQGCLSTLNITFDTNSTVGNISFNSVSLGSWDSGTNKNQSY